VAVIACIRNRLPESPEDWLASSDYSFLSREAGLPPPFLDRKQRLFDDASRNIQSVQGMKTDICSSLFLCSFFDKIENAFSPQTLQEDA
jgi:hypothetical protein